MVVLKRTRDKEVAKLQKEIDDLKAGIQAFRLINDDLRAKIANKKPTKQDVINCKKMRVTYEVQDRFIHCRNGKYTISEDRSKIYNPELFCKYSKELGFEGNNGEYWITLEHVVNYVKTRSYYMSLEDVNGTKN